MSMWLAIFAHSLPNANQTLHENVLNQLFFYDCYGYLFYYNTSWKWNSLTSMHREKSLSSLLLQDKIIKLIPSIAQ